MLERVARRDDYGWLLAHGDVVRRIEEVGDPAAWHARLRAQARADRIRVRTGTTEGVVYARLVDISGRDREEDEYRAILGVLVRASVVHRHEPMLLARDALEVVLRCGRCAAVAYGDGRTGWAGGTLVEDDCPREAAPRPTALTLLFA